MITNSADPRSLGPGAGVRTGMGEFGRRAAFLGVLAALGAAAVPAAGGPLRAEGRFFRDEQGAVVALRGLNLTGDAKVPPFRPITDHALLDRLPGWGVNVARLLFTWEAFEPERERYDTSYLDYYEGVVDALHARGIWVIVDIHQDAFSRFATDGCGEGMPAWAISPSVEPDVPDNGPNCSSWGIKFITDTDTHRSWDDFYADVNGVRTRYLAMLGAIAERLGAHPALLGYDMLNEPWGDEVTQIGPLYEDAARVLRPVDPDAILFVSAQALTSAGEDTLLVRPTFDNFVYSPHYYDANVFLTHSWPGGTLEVPVERMFARANTWNAPLLIGEFGGPGEAENIGAYVDAFYAALDARFASGTQWTLVADWDPVKKDGWNVEDFSILDDAGDLRANFRVRAQPVRISGEPLAFSATVEPAVVELSWIHEPALGATRIFAPSAELFAGRVMVETEGELDCAYDAEGRHLECTSGSTGQMSVRLERCQAGARCLGDAPDTRVEPGGSGGCSSSSLTGRPVLPGATWLLVVLLTWGGRRRLRARSGPSLRSRSS
jgi:endoglycosylceramidase